MLYFDIVRYKGAARGMSVGRSDKIHPHEHRGRRHGQQ